jgi:hypothetical protein
VEKDMDDLDEAIQRWTERLFLAKELLPSDPPTAVGWQREVVSQIEDSLRQAPEELPRLRPALLRAREALVEGEFECEQFQRKARDRNRSFHEHEAEHARGGH